MSTEFVMTPDSQWNLIKRISKADRALWGILQEVIQNLRNTGFSKTQIREYCNSCIVWSKDE